MLWISFVDDDFGVVSYIKTVFTLCVNPLEAVCLFTAILRSL